MKAVLIFCLLLVSGLAAGQGTVQLHGRIFGSDTTRITAWSDGDRVFSKVVVDKVYSVVLGQRGHYTIKLEGGGRVKYCHVFTHGMDVEDLAVDVDFGNSESVIVRKPRRARRQFEFLVYGSRGWRTFSHDYTRIE